MMVWSVLATYLLRDLAPPGSARSGCGAVMLLPRWRRLVRCYFCGGTRWRGERAEIWLGGRRSGWAHAAGGMAHADRAKPGHGDSGRNLRRTDRGRARGSWCSASSSRYAQAARDAVASLNLARPLLSLIGLPLSMTHPAAQAEPMAGCCRRGRRWLRSCRVRSADRRVSYSSPRMAFGFVSDLHDCGWRHSLRPQWLWILNSFYRRRSSVRSPWRAF